MTKRIYEKLIEDSKSMKEVIAANPDLPIVLRYVNDEYEGNCYAYAYAEKACVVDYLEYETDDGEIRTFDDYDDFLDYLLDKFNDVSTLPNMTEDDYCEYVKRKAAEWDNQWRKVILIVGGG